MTGRLVASLVLAGMLAAMAWYARPQLAFALQMLGPIVDMVVKTGVK